MEAAETLGPAPAASAPKSETGSDLIDLEHGVYRASQITLPAPPSQHVEAPRCPPPFAEILASAGAKRAGVVRWRELPGRPRRPSSSTTGIYVVALTDALDRVDGTLAKAPVSMPPLRTGESRDGFGVLGRAGEPDQHLRAANGGLSAAVGPGCPGGDLREQLACSLVVGGVQPQQRPAQLLRFVVLLQTPGAEGQAVQAA
jgi:hypothetical protein